MRGAPATSRPPMASQRTRARLAVPDQSLTPPQGFPPINIPAAWSLLPQAATPIPALASWQPPRQCAPARPWCALSETAPSPRSCRNSWFTQILTQRVTPRPSSWAQDAALTLRPKRSSRRYSMGSSRPSSMPMRCDSLPVTPSCAPAWEACPSRFSLLTWASSPSFTRRPSTRTSTCHQAKQRHCRSSPQRWAASCCSREEIPWLLHPASPSMPSTPVTLIPQRLVPETYWPASSAQSSHRYILRTEHR